MAAMGCSSLSLFATPEGFVQPLSRSVSVAKDARCVKVVHLNRNHSCAYLAGETWKPMFVSSEGGEDIYLPGDSCHYFWDNY